MTTTEPLTCDVAEHSGGLTVVIATSQTPPSLLYDKRFPGHTLHDAEQVVTAMGYAYSGPVQPYDEVGYRVPVTPLPPT